MASVSLKKGMRLDTFCDLHLHLGGSVSKDWLMAVAQSDNDQRALDALTEADVLKLFHVVHDLVNSPERVESATENVITTSSADFLEIRTTPRQFSSARSLRPYVEAFVTTLRRHPRKAKGILSIDRYKHDIEVAREIITLALEYPDCLVGIDISGVNPKGVRTLQGEHLRSCIETTLDSPLGLAIHLGELESVKDQRDSTTALKAIDQWLEHTPGATAVGKIRLGHAIFLGEDHKQIIRKHHLPIEICPTCHRYLGCWRNGQKHPVGAVYPEETSPIVLGTDNVLNFSTSFQRERELFLMEFPYDLAKAWNYRFNRRDS